MSSEDKRPDNEELKTVTQTTEDEESLAPEPTPNAPMDLAQLEEMDKRVILGGDPGRYTRCVLHVVNAGNMHPRILQELSQMPSLPGVLRDSKPIPPSVSLILEKPPATNECLLMKSLKSDDPSRNVYFSDDTVTLCGLKVIYGTYCIRGLVGYTRGIHVWEINWPRHKRGTHAVVGVATQDAPLHCVVHQVLYGSTDMAWGWDAVQQKLYHGAYNTFRPKYPELLNPDEHYIAPDKFLMVLDLDNGNLSYVAHGQYLGIAFHGVRGHEVFPIVTDVWRSTDATMIYYGGLMSDPPPLIEMCRCVIREILAEHKFEERLSQLNLPRTLHDYILYENEEEEEDDDDFKA